MSGKYELSCGTSRFAFGNLMYYLTVLNILTTLVMIRCKLADLSLVRWPYFYLVEISSFVLPSLHKHMGKQIYFALLDGSVY